MSELLKMSNITEQERQEFVEGFLRHVYEEVQTEGWQKRKNCLTGDDYGEDDDDGTFDEMMERYNFNLDSVISSFLKYTVINEMNWFEAWLYKLRPDLDIFEDRKDRKYCGDWLWRALNDFIWVKNVEQIKEILGLSEMMLK